MNSNNPTISILGEDGTSYTVKMDEQPVKSSIDHKHTYKPDPSDQTDSYIAMICRCGFGYLERK